MKAIVMHDHQGIIRAIVTVPPDAPPIATGEEPDRFATEVELPDMPFDATGPENQERILEALRDYRVEFSRQGRLASKRK